jgi:hypothetical protein
VKEGREEVVKDGIHCRSGNMIPRGSGCVVYELEVRVGRLSASCLGMADNDRIIL